MSPVRFKCHWLLPDCKYHCLIWPVITIFIKFCIRLNSIKLRRHNTIFICIGLHNLNSMKLSRHNTIFICIGLHDLNSMKLRHHNTIFICIGLHNLNSIKLRCHNTIFICIGLHNLNSMKLRRYNTLHNLNSILIRHCIPSMVQRLPLLLCC